MTNGRLKNDGAHENLDFLEARPLGSSRDADSRDAKRVLAGRSSPGSLGVQARSVHSLQVEPHATAK